MTAISHVTDYNRTLDEKYVRLWSENMKLRFWLALSLLVSFTTSLTAQKKTRDEQVRDDRNELAKNDAWIYNDLDKAMAKAKATNKPLLLVFR